MFYVYKELPSNTGFRILELLPGQDHEIVSFRLHFADWNDPPPFEALSYAWGDAKRTAFAVCDGSMLPITENLNDGLRHMRYRNVSRYLWADAVCIDQNNMQERGHQVSHMRTIYQKSIKVLVWLGIDKNDQASKATAALQEIGSACCAQSRTPAAQLKDVDDFWGIVPVVPFDSLACDSPDSWHAVAWYLSLTWFRRLWVFQEVNSGSPALMMCGNTSVEWDIAALASTYIRKQTGIRQQWGLQSSHINNIYIMRHRSVHMTFTPPQLLNWVRSFDASDPLDRVYALLGMAPIAKMTPPWRADYSKSRMELYRELATRCVLEVQGLSILACVQHPRDINQDFPSWVPQWDESERMIPISRSFAFDWNSCGPTRVSAEVLKSVLRIEGIVVDTVKSKTDIDNSLWFDSRNCAFPDHPVLEFWRSQASSPTIYPTGEASIEAYAAVLTAGLDRHANKAVEKRVDFRADFMGYIMRLLETSEQDPNVVEETASENWSMFEYRARLCSMNRSVFNTNMGYMGLGPNALLPDDIVCVLLGGIVPFVLRPREGYYQLVGDAYVHGMMDAEAVSKCEAGELARQIFEIH